ncbi:glycerophosphoryl diester phosphodiesterase membrane domain-containing protein [Tsuneonella amylolytica]|uniref:glycerophosphoryl diester phosphodiesterase membrane domain-containing protein n=1 Tax=Tsuneonella amylolytica TaxID=2338327 RepID=UPI0013C3E58B|nr:glycerophosphoryl diester phosphodiesterase membrane domain-containing protein [Tsuneonella amylolytica]
MRLGVSQIMSETFAIARRRFWSLLGMQLTWFAILIGLMIVSMIAIGGGAVAFGSLLSDAEIVGPGAGIGFLFGMLVLYAGYLLIACAQYAAMCTLASPLRRGGFGDAFSSGIRSAPTLLVVFIVMIVGYFVVAFALSAVGALFAAQNSALSLVFGLLVLAVLIWLGSRLGIVLPIVPVDGVRNPIRAIGRAWSLTRGNAVPIFLAFLVFVVVAVVLIALATVPFMGTLAALGLDGSGMPSDAAVGGGVVAMFLLLMLAGVVIAILYAALLSAIHGLLAGGTQAAEVFE